jgi:hypothetical protein
MKTNIRAALWIIVALGLFAPTLAGAETTVIFSGNSLGEFAPCPS